MKARGSDVMLVGCSALAVLGAWGWLIHGQTASGTWPGVDEAVIGRFVVSAGSEPRPLLDWVHGDVLLLAFLLAGLAAGFVLGFFARAALRQDEELS